MASTVDKALIAEAGEMYVLAQLLRREMLAAKTPPRTKLIDLLLQSVDGKTLAEVRVKTRTRGRDRGWHMSKKHEEFRKANHFYVFVDWENEVPDSYIIPSDVVADVLYKSHKSWLAAPGRGGAKHNDHDMRRIRPDYERVVPNYPAGWMTKYKENWDQLRRFK